MEGRWVVEVAPRISVDPGVHHGTPVISGTRVPVSIVVGSLAGGMSQDEVMREYDLAREDIEAALAYAADVVATTNVLPLAEA
jgi:uncharacterized protein (DUF433 family)